MRTIELDITLDDIHQGIPSECAKCPIARALKRTILGAIHVEVDTLNIYFQELPNIRWFAQTPPEAELFIHNFDKGKFVEPFHLTLEFHEMILRRK